MSANASSAAHPGARRSTHLQAVAKASARHRLDVLAVSVSDVISCAGGWLADRALAGWDVNVFVPEVDGKAALRILGVSVHRLADISSSGQEATTPTAVAVSADAVCADSRIKARLDAELARDVAEITVWGPQVPGESGTFTHLRSVQHIPSVAASAFKTHALRAAGLGAGLHTAEIFRSGRGNDDGPRLIAVHDTQRQALPAAAVWAPAPDHTHQVVRDGTTSQPGDHFTGQ